MQKLTNHVLILMISLLAFGLAGCSSTPSAEDVEPLVQAGYADFEKLCVVDNIQVSETVKKGETTRVTATFDVTFLRGFDEIKQEANRDLQRMAQKNPFGAIAQSAQFEAILEAFSEKFGDFKKDDVQSHDMTFEMAQNQDGKWVQI